MWAFICVLIIELLASFLMAQFKKTGQGGDLIRMDHDLFNRNLSIYATPKTDKKKRLRQPASLEEMLRNAPYDTIVFGTSVISTGWVDMLQSEYSLKSVDTSRHNIVRPDLVQGLLDLVLAYPARDSHQPAILLYGDITERSGHHRKIKRYDLSTFSSFQKKQSKRLSFLPSEKVFNYISQKSKAKRVKIVSLNGQDELFHGADVEGLKKDVVYSESELLKLTKFLERCKKLSAEHGFLFAIAAFPTKAQQYEWLLIENGILDSKSNRTNLNVLRRAANANGIPFIDIEEILDPIARDYYEKNGKLFWYRDDTHFNAEGNKHTARIIAEFLQSIKKTF